MNRVIAASIAAGLMVALLTAGCSPQKLSASEIVARSVAARGGLEAWRKVQTMVWTGRIESAHTALPRMRFTLDQKRPNQTRLQLQINALGDKSLRAFDGAHGWKLGPTRGRPEAQPYTPQELNSARAGHGIDGPLIAHLVKGVPVSLKALDEIEGRKVYHLLLHPEQGSDEDVWVDAKTFLEVRYDRMVEGPGGEQRRVSAIYGDYRSVEGLQVPFLISTGGGSAATPDRMQIEAVVLNAPLDDSTFGNPTAAPPRNRGWPSGAPQSRAATGASVAPASAGEMAASMPQ